MLSQQHRTAITLCMLCCLVAGGTHYNKQYETAPPERSLRMVPTIVTAHMFWASRDTRVSYGLCLLIQECFCAVLNYTEKAELSKCFWYPKRKLGVTMHFSEIIKLQFRKKSHTLLYILALFRDVIA